MPDTNENTPVGKQQKLGFKSANQQNTSPHCNMWMFSVLKVIPGSVRVDIPSPSSGLATDVAAKWSRLVVLINPSARRTHLCFWTHTLWLLRQLHLPSLASRVSLPSCLDKLRSLAEQGTEHQSYHQIQPHLLRFCPEKAIPALLFWGPQRSTHKMTPRIKVWTLLQCLQPNWVISSKLFSLSVSRFLHL